MNGAKIIVALDFATVYEAEAFVEMIDPSLCKLKVGKQLFTSGGPEFVKRLVAKGFKVFLDLKFHDIPNTVAGAVKAAAELGVWMVNVHALGGAAMLDAARDALTGSDCLLIAVTILTSFADDTLAEVGLSGTVADNVIRLASLTNQCGLDGVVCSPLECQMLKQRFGAAFVLVTPGIRLGEDSHDDQKRIMTPERAFAAGSDYLVVGRSITRASQPAAVLKQL